MRTRSLLHRNKLEAFAAWCLGEGFSVERNKAVYEVLRVRVPGVAQPVLVYDRSRGDHLTLFGLGERLVRRFIRESHPSPKAT